MSNIYIIGGAKERPDDGFPIWPVVEYDTVADRWIEKGKPPVRFFNHCSAAVKGKIYVIGGINNNLKAVSGVYEYDPRTDTWTKSRAQFVVMHLTLQEITDILYSDIRIYRRKHVAGFGESFQGSVG